MEHLNKLIPKIYALHKHREFLSEGEITQREVNLIVLCLEQFEEYQKEREIEIYNDIFKHLPSDTEIRNNYNSNVNPNCNTWIQGAEHIKNNIIEYLSSKTSKHV